MTANPVRPARYRPGKPIAPEENSDDESSDSDASSASEASPPPPPKPVYKKTGAGISKTLKDVDLSKRFDAGKKVEEARLAEEEAARKKKEEEDDEYTTEESSGSEEEDEEEEEEEEEETEAPRKVLLRPTFVPKSKRSATASAADTDEAKKKEEEEQRQRQEAAELLELHLKSNAEARAAGRKGWDDDEDNGEGIDDTDGLDPAAERAAWKLRELTRIKRERVALAEIEKERAEIERRREMDPTLREKEDLEFVREQKKEKMENRGKMGFMQKFYHKGAFYQEDEILKRNYSTAAVEDAVKNREVLPKYMQVRDEVGKRGRTRWTHLTAEDTSLQEGGNPLTEKKSRANPNHFPVAARGDERFMPDRMRDRKGGQDDRTGGRGGGERSGGERGGDARGGEFGGRAGSERNSQWGEKPWGRRSRDDRDRRSRDDGERRSRWDDDGGRRLPDGPRRDRDRGNRSNGGGDSYVPGRDDDRERKRPHSPRNRDREGGKRQRCDASPAR
jgi:microfibrillar-associated protein 1